MKNKTEPQVSLKSGQKHTSQRSEQNQKKCKHNGGRGYWSNLPGFVCLKCHQEVNSPTEL
jgi:hypothetical protein